VPADWDALSRVLDVATERLRADLGRPRASTRVADTPELRAAYNANAGPA
jgi:oligopeptidase A